MAQPRAIASDLVDAQQARRALDYLVGFNLSPVLWRKVQRGLSAGRVQSPALRMIVEREEEIEAFIAARVLDDRSRAARIRRRHSPPAGQARRQEVRAVHDHRRRRPPTPRASASAQGRAGQRCTSPTWPARSASAGPRRPFITSTLQQEAARKLGFTTRRTMQRGAEAVRRRGHRRGRHGRPDQLHAYRLGRTCRTMRWPRSAT